MNSFGIGEMSSKKEIKKELWKFIRRSMALVARKKEKLKPILGGMEATILVLVVVAFS